MATRALIAAAFCMSIFGLLTATILLDPFTASARLVEQQSHSDLKTRAAGAWEFYADADTVRRNSMDRQREAMAGPLIAQASARLERFTAYAVPLGVSAVVSGLSFLMLALRRNEDDAPTPPRKRRTRAQG
jgi:hypothetical protein